MKIGKIDFDNIPRKKVKIALTVVISAGFIYLTMSFFAAPPKKVDTTLIQDKKIRPLSTPIVSSKMAEESAILAIAQKGEEREKNIAAAIESLKGEQEERLKQQEEIISDINKKVAEVEQKAVEEKKAQVALPTMMAGPGAVNFSPPAANVDNYIRNHIQQKSSQSSYQRKKKSIYIPALSFFEVTLLNGVDAPTHLAAKKDPKNVSMLITGVASVPGDSKLDLRGCRVLGQASGNLSSESAEIKAMRLSCGYRKAWGGIVDVAINGSVVGNHGKEGVKGRKVDNRTSYLFLTLLAKFASAVGEGFKAQSQIVSTTPTGSLSTLDPSKTMESGLYSGLSGTADQLGDYLIKIADSIYPNIEIDIAQQGTLVILQSQMIEPI